ncbi:MAG: DUF1800 domain-containing protein [Pseudoxanthomonas sp.]
MSSRERISAANRFGLGARPGELAGMGDARGWLAAQLQSDPASTVISGLPSSLDYLKRESDYLQQRRQQKQNPGIDLPTKITAAQLYRQSMMQELGRRYQLAVTSESSFIERLVHFWSNHFAISVDKRQAALYAAPMEREAIRPNVLGNFAALLVSVETHPGMLRYLDNVGSVGGDSLLAERARKRAARRGGDAPRRVRGLNENLAREILELHTLGVEGGYSQQDVAELARAITGWGVPMAQDWARGSPNSAFVFREVAHESGTRHVLGRQYHPSGVDQGQAILGDLATHPATARHLSYKLARHFVSDTPPVSLVDRMARAWQDSAGDLHTVYGVLIESAESWATNARKFKTPNDFLVSGLRALDLPPDDRPRMLFGLLTRMGQPPFTPRSPAGFADEAAQWSGPDALWKRVQAAAGMADAAPARQLDPLAVAQSVFADQLDAETMNALRRAESPRDGLALLMASPAFQWRS